MSVKDTMFSGLNDNQAAAVRHRGGPLLILAGPGSGKTRVITARVFWRIAECGDAPDSVLALTFSRQAASEMRARLEPALAAAGFGSPFVGTFHAFCASLLRERGGDAGVPPGFRVWDEGSARAALAAAAGGADGMRRIEPAFRWVRHERALGEAPAASAAAPPAELRAEAASVLAEYGERMRAAGAVDFDGLIHAALRLLRERNAAAEYGRRYRLVVVDEFQDTSLGQYRIAAAIAGAHRDITVVGDPDQSIYAWRDADIRNLRMYAADFPGSQVIALERNYRSSAHVLAAADAVIRGGGDRPDRRLWTSNADGEPVTVAGLADERAEAKWIAGRCAEAVAAGRSPSDIAVLFRTNQQEEPLAAALAAAGVPYGARGGGPRPHPQAQALLAWMRLACDPHDGDAFARAAQGARGLGERTASAVLARARADGVSALDAACLAAAGGAEGLPETARRALRAFAEGMDALTQLAAAGAPARAVLREALRRSGIGERLRADGPEEAREAVRALDALAAAHGPENGLASFLSEVALGGGGVPADGGVRLATLHAAKGLEFPIVFVAGAEEGLLPFERSGGSSESIAEERRLLYVGMTRAQERLFLTHARRRSRRGGARTSGPSRFLRGLPLSRIAVCSDDPASGAPRAPAPIGPPPAPAPARLPAPVRTDAVPAAAPGGEGKVFAPPEAAKWEGRRISIPGVGEGVVIRAATDHIYVAASGGFRTIPIAAERAAA